MKTDVLIIGGGPAGSVAAFQLATAGLEVLLVDRATFPRDKVCGESLSPGAIARLRAIGMWEPKTQAQDDTDADRPAALPIRGMRIRSPRGTTFFGRYRGAASESGLAIRRVIFDRELLAAARKAGARVLEGVEATRVSASTPEGGAVLVKERNQTTFTIDARRIIVADGRRSFIARELGFIEEIRRDRRAKRFAVRAHCDHVTALSDLAEMHVGDSGYCGIAPLSASTANICYVRFADRLDMTPATIAADFSNEIAKYPEIAGRLQLSDIQGAVKVVGPLQLVSNRQACGPFLACGDATGFLDPFTGEGIAHAIASGVLGAEAVRRSLAGSSTAFSEYESKLRSLRRVKSVAARAVHALVSHRRLADAAAVVFARVPRLGDLAVRLFGDQV